MNEPLPNWAQLHWLAQYKNIYYEDFHDEDFKDELTTAVWGDDAEL